MVKKNEQTNCNKYQTANCWPPVNSLGVWHFCIFFILPSFDSCLLTDVWVTPNFSPNAHVFLGELLLLYTLNSLLSSDDLQLWIMLWYWRSRSAKINLRNQWPIVCSEAHSILYTSTKYCWYCEWLWQCSGKVKLKEHNYTHTYRHKHKQKKSHLFTFTSIPNEQKEKKCKKSIR